MGFFKNLFSNTNNLVITKHNVPKPKKVVSLIGWEKVLMDAWVHNGAEGVAGLLGVRDEVYIKRQALAFTADAKGKTREPLKIEVEPKDKGFEHALHYPDLLLANLTEKIEEVFEQNLPRGTSFYAYPLEYGLPRTYLHIPRPDLGWVTLYEYAQLSVAHLHAVYHIIDRWFSYRKPPAGYYEYINSRPPKKGIEERKRNAYKFAYPAGAFRSYRTIWNEPVEKHGTTYYPTEALHNFTAGRWNWCDSYDVKAGERGGYITKDANYPEYDLDISPTRKENGGKEGTLSKIGSWIGEGVYLEGTVEKGSYLQGDMLIPKNTTFTSSTVAGDVYIIGKATVKDSRINGRITLTGEVEIEDCSLEGNITIAGCRHKVSSRETQIMRSHLKGDITLNKPVLIYDTTMRGNITTTGAIVTGNNSMFHGYLHLKARYPIELLGERIVGTPTGGAKVEVREVS
jgi:cytoskeletal protein CcmA (bactofilin family)